MFLIGIEKLLEIFDFLLSDILDFVDLLLYNFVGEGKVDDWGVVVGGEEEGERGWIWICLIDDKFSRKFELMFICIV